MNKQIIEVIVSTTGVILLLVGFIVYLLHTNANLRKENNQLRNNFWDI